MKTIETWLPVFPGFYNTIFEPDETSEIDYINSERVNKGLCELEFDAIKFDYEQYENDIAESCCDYIESLLSDKFIKKLKFQKIRSPREYNFINDSVDIEITLTTENIKNIEKYLSDHLELFAKYIYTSYDGFWSHYSNDVDSWLGEDCLYHTHQLGSILQFIIMNENEGDLVYDMYEYCSDTYLYASNYDDCIDKEYCVECKEFVDPAECIGNVCKDCFDIAVYSGDRIVCCKCKTEIVNAWAKRQYQYKLKHHLIKPNEIICNDCELVLA